MFFSRADKIKSKIDRASIKRLDEKYCTAEHEGYKRKKFLDVDQFFDRNWQQAEQLGLTKSSGLRILDLGSGCGYFPFICRELGHEVFCVDQGGVDIFDDMMQVLGLKRLDLTIKPMTPFDLPWREIDLVTGLMVKFDEINDHSRYGPTEWSFLIDDLSRYLKPDASLYFEFNQLPECPDIEAANIAEFRRRGAEVNAPPLREVTIASVRDYLRN